MTGDSFCKFDRWAADTLLILFAFARMQADVHVDPSLTAESRTAMAARMAFAGPSKLAEICLGEE